MDSFTVSPSVFVEPQEVDFSVVEQSSEPDYFIWLQI